MERNVVKELKCLGQNIRYYLANGENFYKRYNLTQINIIGYLLRHINEEVCQKDLEIETNLKKASITGAVDSLVEKGVVYRKQAEDDKRKNYVCLTQMALDRKKEFEEREVLLNNRIIENISESDIEIFYNVIDSIKKNIKEISR